MSKTELTSSEIERVFGGYECFAIEHFDKAQPYSTVETHGFMDVLFNHEDKNQVLEIINKRKALKVHIETIDSTIIQHCFDWYEFLNFAANEYKILN